MANTAERSPVGPTRGDEEAAVAVGFDPTPRTELVRLLAAARAEYLARFLTHEAFEPEWADERGGED